MYPLAAFSGIETSTVDSGPILGDTMEGMRSVAVGSHDSQMITHNVT